MFDLSNNIYYIQIEEVVAWLLCSYSIGKYRRTNKRIYKESKTEIRKQVNLSIKTVIKGYKYRIYSTEEQKELTETKNSIGLDLGIPDILITSNGETFKTINLHINMKRNQQKYKDNYNINQNGIIEFTIRQIDSIIPF